MKEKIPTRKVEFDYEDTKIEVEFYQWLTQEEENEYTLLLSKPENYTDGKLLLTPSTIVEARKYLIVHMIKNLSWDDYNVLSPSLRELIANETVTVKNDGNKKK